MLPGAAGVAGVAGLIPESIQRAYAIEPEVGSSYVDAEHVVILMQENRSFDHTFGTLRGVRGFDDPRAIRLANGNSVFVQTDGAGNSYAPWRLDIRDTRVTWMGSLPHSRNSQVDAWNEGHHDGWIEAKRSHVAEYADLPLTMGHYSRDDLPFYYALADAFTVCDQNYCSGMTSTTPNRSYFWTGTVREKQRTDSKAYMRNEEMERGGMTWKTYPERLHDAGISWKSYQNELTFSGGLNDDEIPWLSNFGDNVLEYFKAYNVEAHAGRTATARSRLANGDRVRYAQLSERERALHDAAFVTNREDSHFHSLENLEFEDRGERQTMLVPKGDILYQFRKDVSEGELPAVCWLIPPERFSDHPTSPWYGAWYVSEVLNILTKNPAVWKKTIFILTYDENDGYFDHAPSFVAADPKRPETGRASAGIDTGLEYTYAAEELEHGVNRKEARSGPIGMGFRVPMIIASPWSRGGWVNSQLFDHTSSLMFLEHFVQAKFGKSVKEENISGWRRCISGDLTSAFRRYNATEPQLEFLDRNKSVVRIQQARFKEIPSNYRKLSPEQIENINTHPFQSDFISHQEPGIRPSCGLPYELYVDGALSADRKKFMLRMKVGDTVHKAHSAGAPFNVYLRNTRGRPGAGGKLMNVATYVVAPGGLLEEEFPLSLFIDGQYSIEVHAPNGFYRAFAGDAEAPVDGQTVYERTGSSLTGNVQLNLENTGERSLEVLIEDHSYGAGAITKTLAARAKTSLVLDLKRSYGWYDFTVRAEDAVATARFAGRVETGQSSFSDPWMGGVALS